MGGVKALNLKSKLRDNIGAKIWDKIPNRVAECLYFTVWDKIVGRIFDRTKNRVGGQIWDLILNQVIEQLEEPEK